MFPSRVSSSPCRMMVPLQKFRRNGDWLASRQLQISEQQQNEEDNQNQTQSAAWIITPAPTIGPARKRANQQQDQDDKYDGRDRHNLVGVISSARVRRVFHLCEPTLYLFSFRDLNHFFCRRRSSC